MTKTFTDLQSKLNRFADDALQEDASGEAQARRFSLPLRIDGWNWAQDVFVHHTPRQQSASLTIDTGERSALLPDDFFDVKGIYDSYNEYWWSKVTFSEGDYRDPDSDIPQYWIWDDSMILEREVDYDVDYLTLYYWAYYPEIEYSVGSTDEDITYEHETIYVPRWAESALIHLAIAYCWQPGSMLANDINEWKISVDAGTPMHNPRQAAAWDHMRWYNELLRTVSPARR